MIVSRYIDVLQCCNEVTMLHAHKELLISTDNGPVWEHLDVLRIRNYAPDYISKFAERCFVGKFEKMTRLTNADIRFLVPGSVYDIRNISNAKQVWDDMMVIPFNSTFGCWPWDYADMLDDPLTRKDLEEYDILDARLILLM